MTEKFITGLVNVLQRTVDGPRVAGRFAALEARIAELEARPNLEYCGTWKAGTTHQPGDAATHHGALWVCKSMTAGEPSRDYAGWQLAVKEVARDD